MHGLTKCNILRTLLSIGAFVGVQAHAASTATTFYWTIDGPDAATRYQTPGEAAQQYCLINYTDGPRLATNLVVDTLEGSKTAVARFDCLPGMSHHFDIVGGYALPTKSQSPNTSQTLAN